jgi:hypothetical protein
MAIACFQRPANGILCDLSHRRKKCTQAEPWHGRFVTVELHYFSPFTLFLKA